MRKIIRPKKQLGQVFLKERKILELIADSLGLEGKGNVLEIGAGYGNLTEVLLGKLGKGKVFALEKDEELAALLEEKFNGEKVVVVKGDVREIGLESFLEKKGIKKIIGNIPYYLSGWLLGEVLDFRSYPEKLVLVLQKEVGEKILSEKGSFLSQAFSFVSQVKKIRLVKAGSFYPRPKVDSMIVRFSFFGKQENYGFRAGFFRFLKISFRQPRKALFSNLEKGGFSKVDLMSALENSDLDLRVRPHQLSLEAWLKLFRILEGKKVTEKKRASFEPPISF